MKIKYNTEPRVITNKKMNEIVFRLIFPFIETKESSVYINYLSNFLQLTSHQYPDSKVFLLEQKKNYVLDINCSSFFKNNIGYFTYEFIVPKKGIFPNYDINKALKFVVDSLYNPFVKNCQFDKERFNYEKNYYLKKVLDQLQDMYTKNSEIVFKYIDPTEIIYLKNKSLIKINKEVNEKKLYDFYQKIIINNNCFSFIYGNITKQEGIELFQKYFNKQSKECSLISSNQNLKIAPISSKPIVINTLNKQTEINFIIQFDSLTKKERIYSHILIDFLESFENRLLSKKLRLDNNLIYWCDIKNYLYYNFFIIKVYSDYHYFDIITTLINEIIADLQNKKNVELYINNLINGTEIDLLKQKDNIFYILNEKSNIAMKKYTINSQLKIIKNISIDDMLIFFKKISITKTIVLKGEENE